MKNIATFLASLFILNAGAQIPYMSNWKTQTDLQFFSTMQYPPDWEADEFNNEGYIIKSPLESDTDAYRENISFFAIELPDSTVQVDVKKFAEVTFSTLKKTIKDTRLMLNKYVTINGINMYLVVYNGVANDEYLYWKQVFCIYKKIAYTLTYTGQAGKKDNYAITGTDMLFSFKPNNAAKE